MGIGSIISAAVKGLSALAQWGAGFFKAKNSAPVVRSVEADQDQTTLKKADQDLQKGDVEKLGEDISS